MRIPIVRGRNFLRADFGNAPPVALVSRDAARQILAGRRIPIGQRIAFADSQNEWMEVVGIVEDVRNTDADLAPSPQVYVPSAWRPERATTFVVRSAGADPVAACAVNPPRARAARQNTARLRCHEHAAP